MPWWCWWWGGEGGEITWYLAKSLWDTSCEKFHGWGKWFPSLLLHLHIWKWAEYHLNYKVSRDSWSLHWAKGFYIIPVKPIHGFQHDLKVFFLRKHTFYVYLSFRFVQILLIPQHEEVEGIKCSCCETEKYSKHLHRKKVPSIHPKSKNVCRFCFSVQKICRKSKSSLANFFWTKLRKSNKFIKFSRKRAKVFFTALCQNEPSTYNHLLTAWLYGTRPKVL